MLFLEENLGGRSHTGLDGVSRPEEDPASAHLDFNVKPARAPKVENACVGGETTVTTGPHKHCKMLMRSEGYLPSAHDYSDCVHEYGPPNPTRYSFDGSTVRANPAMLTTTRMIVKLPPGSNAHQIMPVPFYQKPLFCNAKLARRQVKTPLRWVP